VRFATATEQLAEQARYIAYGPARLSAGRRIGLHADSGVDIRPHLPTWPTNLGRAIHKDHRWYARTQRRLDMRFQLWLEGN
jgi:putative spermidine/putrescine transport system substrate-binding protein